MDWNNINRDRDTSGLGPIEYDQTKVPQLIRKHADNVRTKTYGQEVREAQARNAELAGLIASEAENIANDADLLSKDTQNRFKDQIEGTTNSDEVIDARRPFGAETAFQTLGERLENGDKANLQIKNTVSMYVNPSNFNSLQECIDYAYSNDKIIKADKLVFDNSYNFRGIGLEITKIILNGNSLTLGAFNVADPTKPNETGKQYRPKQHIGIIDGNPSNQHQVKIIGASYQTIVIDSYNGYVQMLLDNYDGTGNFEGLKPNRFIAYSKFEFRDVTGVEVKEDRNVIRNSEDTLWANENIFNLGNTVHFRLGDEGGYVHNMNVINNGTFEGNNAKILVYSGNSNVFNGIRAEGVMKVEFGVDTENNSINFTHRLYKPLVKDLGINNTVLTGPELNLRLLTLDELASVRIVDGTAGTQFLTITPPWFNLKYDNNSKSYKQETKYGGNVVYESPFYSNPKNVRFLFESNLKSGNGFGVGYKFYDTNYNDITSDLGINGLYAVSSHESTNQQTLGSYGAFRGPSLGLNAYGNVNSTDPIKTVKNDTVSLIPSSNFKRDTLGRIKFVKFFVMSLSTDLEFHDARATAYDMSSNYHTRYFANTPVYN